MEYTKREQVFLVILAVVGFAGLNGIFVWALLNAPQAVSLALGNPVAIAFMAEAFVLMGVLAYLLGRWKVSRLHWAWFVLLSLVGGIAFALPVVVLWRARGRDASAQ